MEPTTVDDLELVVTHVAGIPLPRGNSIITEMPKDVIEAARRLVEDKEAGTLRK
jgi:hypothetical protein